MRENKFRGRRLDNGEWVYGAYLTIQHNTGLKDDGPDEKKEEIYEGDKVQATNRMGWTREFVIMWNEDRTRFMVWEGSQPNISFDLTCDTIIEYHVVVTGDQ